MTLTIELGLDNVKLNQRAKYAAQSSFRWKVVVRTNKHTKPTDCFTWSVGNNVLLTYLLTYLQTTSIHSVT